MCGVLFLISGLRNRVGCQPSDLMETQGVSYVGEYKNLKISLSVRFCRALSVSSVIVNTSFDHRSLLGPVILNRLRL